MSSTRRKRSTLSKIKLLSFFNDFLFFLLLEATVVLKFNATKHIDSCLEQAAPQKSLPRSQNQKPHFSHKVSSQQCQAVPWISQKQSQNLRTHLYTDISCSRSSPLSFSSDRFSFKRERGKIEKENLWAVGWKQWVSSHCKRMSESCSSKSKSRIANDPSIVWDLGSGGIKKLFTNLWRRRGRKSI